MDTAVLISLLGIVISFVLLIILVMRGVNILIIAFICSAVVAVTSGMDIFSVLKEEYMTGFVGFFKNYFLIFLTGTLLGKMMDITKASQSIAKAIIKIVGPDKALLSIPLACGILAYGGVSAFVVSFAVFPIALELFRQADLPRRFIPAALTFGCSTFAMIAPGAPQIHNFIPAKELGTELMAGAAIGFISCGFMLLLGSFMLIKMVGKEKAAGAHFIAKPQDVFSDEEVALPNPFVALIPLIVTILIINIKINDAHIVPLEVGLSIGALTALLLMFKYQDRRKLADNLGEVCRNSIFSIANTCTVVGYGAVVKAALAFPFIVQHMVDLPGPPLASAAIGTTIIAGITGSASGGLAIAVPILKDAFLSRGISAAVLHRTMAISSAALDSLPHNGYIVTVTNSICNETHKDAYMPVFWLTVFVPFLGSIVAVILFSMFGG